MVGIFNEILGRDVEVPESPKRIVSFSPAVTETLFMLGLGDRLVGVSAFCARPPEARSVRRVGSYDTVRPELLEELAPDLVFAVTGYQRSFAVNLSKRHPTYPLELPVSVAGIADFALKVGLVAGAHERARELERELVRCSGGMEKVGPVRVYVELDLGGPVTFGAYSYITDAVRLLGCSSLFDLERQEWLRPDLGRVEKEDPDAIIYEPKMFAQFGLNDFSALISDRGWEKLRAVRSGSSFFTPRPLDFLAHHGPSFIAESLPWLRARLLEAREREGLESGKR